MSLTAELWSVLSPPQRRRVIAAQFISVAMAFSTVTGIAAIAPFFAVLGEPRLIDQNRLLHWLYTQGGFASEHGFVVALGCGFVAVVLLANLVNALGSLAMNRLVLRIGAELQTRLFGEYLQRSYAFHSSHPQLDAVQRHRARDRSRDRWDFAECSDSRDQSRCGGVHRAVRPGINTAASLTMLMGLAGGYALIYLCVRAGLLRWAARIHAPGPSRPSSSARALAPFGRSSCCRTGDYSTRASSGRAGRSRTPVDVHAAAQIPKHVMECVAVRSLWWAPLWLSGTRSEGMGPGSAS